MRELRGDLNATVAQRHDRQLPLQRLRSLPQDERNQPTAGEAEKLSGLLLQKGRDCVRQLQHRDNNAVATNGCRRYRLQRVRALPEDPQPAAADHVEEGQRANEEEKAEQGGDVLLPSSVSLLSQDGGDDDGLGPLEHLHHLRLVLLLLERLLVPIPAELNGGLPCLILLTVLFRQPGSFPNIRYHWILLNLLPKKQQSYDLSCYCCISK